MAFCPVQARADTIALSFTPSAQIGVPIIPLTFGWAFSLSSPVLLTQLGLWDGPAHTASGTVGDGLGQSHLVTVWTSTGTQLAQETIPAGTSATLTDGFRYVSLTAAVVLPAGNYTIGAFFPVAGVLEPVASQAFTVSTASGVTYIGSRREHGSGFPPGDISPVPNSWFGPNFQFTAPTTVPDAASTWMLLLLGVTATLGLNFLLRRRASVAAV